MKSHDKYRDALLSRLRELDLRLHNIESELDTPPSKDWEEMAVEREGDEVLERLGRSGQNEVTRIRAALQRLREGRFGECVQCHGQISAERLDILPETPLCKECAASV